MLSKYRMMGEKFLINGREVSRVVANVDFGNVKAETVGGFIQDTRNLSFEGNCWVAEHAVVLDDARVSGNGVIGGSAMAMDHAVVTDNAYVGDYVLLDRSAYIGGNAILKNTTYVSDAATILGNSRIYCKAFRRNSGKTLVPNIGGLARIKDHVILEGCPSIRGHAEIGDYACITGRVKVCEHASIGDFAFIEGLAEISGNARVVGHCHIRDRSRITNNAFVGGHVLVVGKSLITGRACVVGEAIVKNQTYSGDQYVTTQNGWLYIVPNCPPDHLSFARRINATA